MNAKKPHEEILRLDFTMKKEERITCYVGDSFIWRTKVETLSSPYDCCSYHRTNFLKFILKMSRMPSELPSRRLSGYSVPLPLIYQSMYVHKCCTCVYEYMPQHTYRGQTTTFRFWGLNQGHQTCKGSLYTQPFRSPTFNCST